MQFLSELRDRIRRGEITCSVRLWQRSHVKVGGRYAMPPGRIVVTAVTEMSLEDITPVLARRSGFAGVVDLLKTAKHGPGRRVFLIEFRYQAPERPQARQGLTRGRRGLAATGQEGDEDENRNRALSDVTEQPF